jgi:hypothetical protein
MGIFPVVQDINIYYIEFIIKISNNNIYMNLTKKRLLKIKRKKNDTRKKHNQKKGRHIKLSKNMRRSKRQINKKNKKKYSLRNRTLKKKKYKRQFGGNKKASSLGPNPKKKNQIVQNFKQNIYNIFKSINNYINLIISGTQTKTQIDDLEASIKSNLNSLNMILNRTTNKGIPNYKNIVKSSKTGKMLVDKKYLKIEETETGEIKFDFDEELTDSIEAMKLPDISVKSEATASSPDTATETPPLVKTEETASSLETPSGTPPVLAKTEETASSPETPIGTPPVLAKTEETASSPETPIGTPPVLAKTEETTSSPDTATETPDVKKQEFEENLKTLLENRYYPKIFSFINQIIDPNTSKTLINTTKTKLQELLVNLNTLIGGPPATESPNYKNIIESVFGGLIKKDYLKRVEEPQTSSSDDGSETTPQSMKLKIEIGDTLEKIIISKQEAIDSGEDSDDEASVDDTGPLPFVPAPAPAPLDFGSPTSTPTITPSPADSKGNDTFVSPDSVKPPRANLQGAQRVAKPIDKRKPTLTTGLQKAQKAKKSQQFQWDSTISTQSDKSQPPPPVKTTSIQVPTISSSRSDREITIRISLPQDINSNVVDNKQDSFLSSISQTTSSMESNPV